MHRDSILLLKNILRDIMKMDITRVHRILMSKKLPEKFKIQFITNKTNKLNIMIFFYYGKNFQEL